MAKDYVEREAVLALKHYDGVGLTWWAVVYADDIEKLPAADVAPVVHGRWVECDDDDHLGDAYNHHKCTNCNTAAPYSYQYREDWDEGMDGEWYSLGIIDDGINEHLTAYCPNCGARMDGE